MSGKRLILVFFALLLAFLGFIFWIGATGGGTANRPLSTASASATATGAESASGTPQPGAAIAKKISDRRVRDELRQRILAGWAASGEDEETRTAARAGRFVPRPDPDGGAIDPKYIQAVVREDFFPMARKCYEELLARKPDAGGSVTVEIEFTIVADDELGGIVEDAGLGDGGTLTDEKMATCLQESFTTLAFPPPAHDGVVSVRYPIVFTNDHEPTK